MIRPTYLRWRPVSAATAGRRGISCDSGWASAWFDALYTCLWPFVLTFKGLYVGGRYVWRKYRPIDAASTPKAAKAASAEAATKGASEQPPNAVFRVFGQFSLLWCADWIESFEGPFSKQLADAIRAVRESDAQDQSQQVKNAANILKFAETVCRFLADKKRALAKLTRVVSFCVTVPVYIYISSVFATVYGVARIEHLSLDWR